MSRKLVLAVTAIGVMLSGCGRHGTKDLDCDKGQRFQNRVQGKRIVAPEGLDPLNEFAEMPIPAADPDAAPPPAGRCVDMPPEIRTGD